MNELTVQIVVGAGLLGLTVSGFGLHILDNFSGRRLDAFARVMQRRDRYRQILMMQEAAFTGCRYLYLLSISSFLIGATLLVVNRIDPQSPEAYRVGGFGPLMLVYSIAAATIVILLLSIWLPRLIERLHAARVVFHTWPLFLIIARIAQPLSLLDSFFDLLGQRLTDSNEEVDEEEELEDEIRTLVETGVQSGLVREGIPSMIQKVLNLDERSVGQIMTPRSDIDALNVAMPYAEALQSVSEFSRTRVPVYEGSLDNIIGILFVKDLFAAIADESIELQPPENRVRSILRDVWRIPAGLPINELLSDFLHKRTHMAVVVGDFGRCIGIITIEDALEEIVGEIADEHDEPPVALFDTDDGGSITANGIMLVNDLNQQFGLDLPESDDYDTIAGLIIWQTKQLPAVKFILELENLKIEVIAANERQIHQVRISHQHHLETDSSEGLPSVDPLTT